MREMKEAAMQPPRGENQEVPMSMVWLITGSSRGLGRALAETVLAEGHQLVAAARDPEQLADLVERYGDQVRTVALDETDARAASRAIRTAVDAFGRLDVLVNNPGYGDVGSIEDTSDADFRAHIETNLFGVVNLTKAASRASITAAAAAARQRRGSSGGAE
jgi:NAD(P)-dependent dehydrogenase (short-subunit alcohol dehydrogenase family)